MFSAGTGRHIICLTPQQASDVVKWSTLAQIVEVIGIAFVKISVCFFILRVLDRASQRLTQFLKTLILFIVACHVAPLLLFVLQCRPLQAVWNPTVKGQCYSEHLTYTAAYVAIGKSFVALTFCAVIPIFVIFRLQMSLRTKVAISALMGLGVLTAACAIAKAVYLDGVFAEDYTWAITTPAIWSIVETQLGLNIASIPAIRPLSTKLAEVSGLSARSSSPVFEKVDTPLHRFASRERGLYKASSRQEMLRRGSQGTKETANVSVNAEPDLEYGFERALAQAHPVS
ncbi:hypothetical protein MMC13_004106 [Lambiella insularis]|nr:hypothetical protein [Lambiella insularis]